MTDALWLAFDLILAGTILALAFVALGSRDAFRMIVLFIVFGLLVALAWIRLRAPDVALAEAAIGAGLTGALFLRTWRHIVHRPRAEAGGGEPGEPGTLFRLAVGAGAAVVALALGAALLALPRPSPGLLDAVSANLAVSGVANPVTAVLLNFRGYDTLLEVVVLFAAVVCVWLAQRTLPSREPGSRLPLGPVFESFARLALPAMALVAGYLLWLGAFAPGGAFQGGAVLAAACVLLLLGRAAPPVADGIALRTLLVAGLGVFAAAAVAAAGLGRNLLEYPPAQAKTWILAIEAVLTLSIAATLAALFHGAAPAFRRDAPRGGRR